MTQFASITGVGYASLDMSRPTKSFNMMDPPTTRRFIVALDPIGEKLVAGERAKYARSNTNRSSTREGQGKALPEFISGAPETHYFELLSVNGEDPAAAYVRMMKTDKGKQLRRQHNDHWRRMQEAAGKKPPGTGGDKRNKASTKKMVKKVIQKKTKSSAAGGEAGKDEPPQDKDKRPPVAESGVEELDDDADVNAKAEKNKQQKRENEERQQQEAEEKEVEDGEENEEDEDDEENEEDQDEQLRDDFLFALNLIFNHQGLTRDNGDVITVGLRPYPPPLLISYEEEYEVAQRQQAADKEAASEKAEGKREDTSSQRVVLPPGAATVPVTPGIEFVGEMSPIWWFSDVEAAMCLSPNYGQTLRTSTSATGTSSTGAGSKAAAGDVIAARFDNDGGSAYGENSSSGNNPMAAAMEVTWQQMFLGKGSGPAAELDKDGKPKLTDNEKAVLERHERREEVDTLTKRTRQLNLQRMRGFAKILEAVLHDYEGPSGARTSLLYDAPFDASRKTWEAAGGTTDLPPLEQMDGDTRRYVQQYLGGGKKGGDDEDEEKDEEDGENEEGGPGVAAGRGGAQECPVQ